MTTSLQDDLASHLEPSEVVHWHGAPAWRALMHGQWGTPALGGLLLPGALAVAAAAWPKLPAPLNVAVAGFCGLTAVLALSMLDTPRHLHRQARRTVYAVTNRRALLLRTGARPLVQAYVPGDIQFVRQEPAGGHFHVTFGLDRRGGFLPQAGPGVGYTPVGFGGLTATEATRAQRALADLQASAGRAVSAPVDAARHLEGGGSFEAFLVKLGALLKREGDGLARRRHRAYTLYQVVFGLGAVALVGGTLVPDAFDRMALWLVFGLVAFGVFAAMRARFERLRAELAEDTRLERMLGAWRQDAHARTRLLGHYDLTDAGETRPVRTARSPYSGSEKTYHKHTWASLCWAFADGNMVTLSLTDKVKRKAGTVVRREQSVRGRLKVDPGRYKVASLPPTLALGPLSARVLKRNGGAQVLFWGELDDLEALPQALEALYGELRARAKHEQSA